MTPVLEWSHVERVLNADSKVSQIDSNLPIGQPKGSRLSKGLCPDRQLSRGKGSRGALESQDRIEALRARVKALCTRVQDLEFALGRAHALVTNERHPLLEDELIKFGQDSRALVITEPGGTPTAPPEDVLVADFGNVKIAKSGSYRWLGVGDYDHIIDIITHMFT